MSNEAQVLPLAMTADVAKAVADALNPEDIKAAVIAEAQKQGLAAAAAADQATADKAKADADKLAADTAAAVGFTRTETIGGREFTFEASSELELERMVNNAFKVAYAVQTTPEPAAAAVVVDPAIAAAAKQKEADEAALAKVELETKFKRGDITAAEYIEQSGAMADYLAKQGVPLDALRASLEHTQEAAEEQSWAAAVEEFKNSPVGADWPGGQNNLEIIGLKLQSMTDSQGRPLSEAKDKVAALATAYASMKSSNTIFPFTPVAAAAATPTAEQIAAKAITDKAAADAAAIAAARVSTTPRVAAKSSSVFGASSGPGAEIKTGAVADAPKVDIPANATPAEIIDAWKKAQVANGQDPNAVFMDTFRGARA